MAIADTPSQQSKAVPEADLGLPFSAYTVDKSQVQFTVKLPIFNGV